MNGPYIFRKSHLQFTGRIIFCSENGKRLVKSVIAFCIFTKKLSFLFAKILSMNSTSMQNNTMACPINCCVKGHSHEKFFSSLVTLFLFLPYVPRYVLWWRTEANSYIRDKVSKINIFIFYFRNFMIISKHLTLFVFLVNVSLVHWFSLIIFSACL